MFCARIQFPGRTEARSRSTDLLARDGDKVRQLLAGDDAQSVAHRGGIPMPTGRPTYTTITPFSRGLLDIVYGHAMSMAAARRANSATLPAPTALIGANASTCTYRL
jgi:hypothetical protein